jgi:gas vesicle protein
MKEEGAYRKTWSILVSFAVGGLVGAGVALLLAPKSGKELRKDIEGLATDTRDQIAATIEKGKVLYEGGTAAVKHGVEAGKTAYLTDMEKLRKAV